MPISLFHCLIMMIICVLNGFPLSFRLSRVSSEYAMEIVFFLLFVVVAVFCHFFDCRNETTTQHCKV